MSLIAPGDTASSKDEARKVPDEREGFPRPEVVFIDDDRNGWFLFRYTLAGTFGGDTWHENLEQAKAQANYEYGATLGEWKPVPDGMDPIEFARECAIGADRHT